MKRANRRACRVIGIVVAVMAALPAAGLAQETVVQPFPRNNVRGGSIAARRPGTWIQSGIATHSLRQDASLHAFGGATITQVGPEPSIRDEVLPQVIDVLLGILDQFVLLVQAILGGTTTTGS